MDVIEKITTAVLYEGYLLWPYRRSAGKNQQRWTFGGVYPRAYSEAGHEDDPWLMQTQCLVRGDDPRVRVRVRFLHVVEREVARRQADGTLEVVDELRIGSQRFLTWEEATERDITVDAVQLAALEQPRHVPIAVAAGQAEEPLRSPEGEAVGALLRRWRGLEGNIVIGAEQVEPALFRLTVTIANHTPWHGQPREETLKQSFNSTHTILTVQEGDFISMTDPPDEFEGAVAACKNIKTWPVLAGEEGDTHTVLSSPIILYDYPQVAPESPGDLFDGGEIDQLLVLNILTLTDEEKEEMRATDPRAREILERTEALTTDDFMNLHGAIRGFRTLGSEDDWDILIPGMERPAPTSVTVNGSELRKGSQVRLRPRPGGDIMDLALDGKIAIVEAIEQDWEERVQLAVVLRDDPGRELGLMRQPGHRFFFAPEEVEPLGADA